MLATTALAIMTTSVLVFSAQSSHTSSRTGADQQAYSLAEAGHQYGGREDLRAAADPRVT